MDNRKKAALLTGLTGLAFGGLGFLMFTKKGTELRGRLGNLAKQKVNDLKKENPHYANANRSVKNKGFIE